MKQICYIIIVLIFQTSCGNTQPTSNRPKLTGNIQSDLKIFLPNAAVTADIMDGVLQNARQVELQQKFQSAIQENQEWFVEHMKNITAGEPIPYDERLGLTKDEYTELQKFYANVEIVSTGEGDIIIEVKNDTIHFKSEGKLTHLDSLTIDLKNNIVIFGRYKMSFSDTLNIADDKNGLKSKWTGYEWKSTWKLLTVLPELE